MRAHLSRLVGFFSVPTLAAVSISSLVIGYYLGTGHALLRYSSSPKKGHVSEDDLDSELETEEEDETPGANKPPPRGECKLVLVVRQDLKMEKGKIAAQCGHATLAAYKYNQTKNPELLRHWERRGQAKVVVKAPSKEVFDEVQRQARAKGVFAYAIQDAGRTQVEPGSRTVLAVGPAPLAEVDALTRHLKLL